MHFKSTVANLDSQPVFENTRFARSSLKIRYAFVRDGEDPLGFLPRALRALAREVWRSS